MRVFSGTAEELSGSDCVPVSLIVATFSEFSIFEKKDRNDDLRSADGNMRIF